MGSPTYATDLASVILEILQNKIFKEKKFTAGVYHYSNRGGISWHKFAEKIFEIGKVDCKVNAVKTNQYPTSAKRPKNTVMDIDKIVIKGQTTMAEIFKTYIIKLSVLSKSESKSSAYV